jgi:hypothetical protein
MLQLLRICSTANRSSLFLCTNLNFLHSRVPENAIFTARCISAMSGQDEWPAARSRKLTEVMPLCAFCMRADTGIQCPPTTTRMQVPQLAEKYIGKAPRESVHGKKRSNTTPICWQRVQKIEFRGHKRHCHCRGNTVWPPKGGIESVGVCDSRLVVLS